MTDEIRKQALAEYLGIDAEDIGDSYGEYEYSTDEGDYLVVTEEEAESLAREDIKLSVDEMGLDAFTEDFQEWIKENALDSNWFVDAMDEDSRNYAEDIQYEDGRYREELIDAGLISRDDERTDDELTEDYELFDDFVEYLNGRYDDAVEWYIDNFGTGDLKYVIDDNPNILDVDAVCDKAIELDGIAHFISTYDGEEIELGDYDGEWLYAYRTN